LRRPDGFDVSLLSRALGDAHAFAFQRFRGRQQAAVFFGDQSVRGVVETVRERDVLFALLVNGHGRQHRVEFLRPQGRDAAVERGLDPFALDLEFGADGIAQINIKTHQFTLFVFGFEGCEGRVDAEANLGQVLGQDAGGCQG